MKKSWFRRLAALLLAGALLVPAAALAEDAVEIDAIVEDAGNDEFAEAMGEVDLFDPGEADVDAPAEVAVNGMDVEPVANAGGVALNEKNFPDAGFRALLSGDGFDWDGDGSLSESERENVEWLGVDEQTTSLKGIEYLTNLQQLVALNTRVTSVDLSKNKKLDFINFEGTKLKTLDIGGCPNLLPWLDTQTEVGGGCIMWGTNLYNSKRDVHICIDLGTELTANGEVLYSNTAVAVDSANFPSADFRKYVKAQIDCNGDGWLTEAEMNAVTDITLRTYEDVESDKNPMNCANLEGVERFPNLQTLSCMYCGIKTLDVSQNTRLRELYCDNNQLTSLKLGKNKNLRIVSVGYNKLSKLDVSGNTALISLYCLENQLKSLDVRKNTALDTLSCGQNSLSKLDVTANKKLTNLFCEQNKLSKLNVSKNKGLVYLYCGKNKLSKLDVSKNTKLKGLFCASNKLKKLSLTKNKALEDLECQDNKLTALDLSKNTKLKYLHAYKNKIKKIDLKKCSKLRDALKLTKKKEKKYVQWGSQESWGYFIRLYIDKGTKLYNGKKALYKGK